MFGVKKNVALRFKTLADKALQTMAFSVILSLTSLSAFAAASTTTQPTDSTKEVSMSNVQQASITSQAWLNEVDKGHYAQSWDMGSTVFKLTISKEEWIKALDAIRKPLGSLISREIVDERTAKDPHKLPKGDYVVMVYKTSFATKSSATEIVTLYKEDGKWQVLTYQVD